MSAWTKLLEASSALAGTAWERLSSPKTGTGVVINDGYTVSIAGAIQLDLVMEPIDLVLTSEAYTSEVQDAAIQLGLEPSTTLETP